MDLLYWLTSAAALIGVWLNIKKHSACFAIWAVTNLIWLQVDFARGIYPQAALQGVYCLLSFYGLITWTLGGPDGSASRETKEKG